MYGGWTKNVVLWRIFLGFFCDIRNVLMIYNYWVCFRACRRSNNQFGCLRFYNKFFFKYQTTMTKNVFKTLQ